MPREGDCHFWLLVEPEVRYVLAAVAQLDGELTAGASPGLIRLPDVGIRIRHWIVREAAATRCNGLFNGILR